MLRVFAILLLCGAAYAGEYNTHYDNLRVILLCSEQVNWMILLYIQNALADGI